MNNYLECIPKNHNGQRELIKKIMLDFDWHIPEDVARATGIKECSVKSRMRDLTLQKYGGYMKLRTKISEGVFAYRLVKPNTTQEVLF